MFSHYVVMELVEKMSDIAELFTELMFGEGCWLGLILIVAIITLTSAKSRIANIAFIPISVFIGILYFDNIEANNNFMWAGIIMFVVALLLGYKAISESRG